MRTDRRKKNPDDFNIIKEVIETFLKNQKIYTGNVHFLMNNDGIHGNSTVSVVVLDSKLLSLQEKNDELWSNLIQLIHLLGFTYILEENGLHLRILKS
jgi:hypothetical protein